MARRLLFSRLERLREGRITIQEGTERHSFGAPTAEFPVDCSVKIEDPRFYASAVLGGTVGAGEAYAQGHWTADDPAEVVRVLVRNRGVLEAMDAGPARLLAPACKLIHALRRNSRRGSRRNIAAHYDLGNDFFAGFLDPTMTYSSGVYARPEASLEEAQIEKLDRICRKLQLSAADEVCEIGTGWGSFALHAAANYGCRVTTTTISKRQYELASERIRAAGLDDRVSLLLRDYRDLAPADGRGLAARFDKLVSIEMIEAVGHRYLGGFFATCARLLRPSGTMALQAITIAEQFHDQALRSVDFIQRYIFPGCYIPSLGSMTAAVGRATDLRFLDLEDIGLDYARTLREWRGRFRQAGSQYRALGYDEAFLRLWEFYFAYCEGGFRERQISDVQIVLGRSHSSWSALGRR